MKEIWKPIAGYNGLYQASNIGRVRRNGTILHNFLGTNKYLNVDLYLNGEKKQHRVHRLVAAAFIPNPENKPTVNHKDGDKQNNIVTNLEWATRSENILHSYRELGRTGPRGAATSCSIPFHIKFPDGTVVRYAGAGEFTRETGFNHQNISYARNKGLPYRFKKGKIKGLEVRA